MSRDVGQTLSGVRQVEGPAHAEDAMQQLGPVPERVDAAPAQLTAG